MSSAVFTKFCQIEKRFDKSNVVSHESFTFWFLETQNSLRRFLNGADENYYLTVYTADSTIIGYANVTSMVLESLSYLPKIIKKNKNYKKFNAKSKKFFKNRI